MNVKTSQKIKVKITRGVGMKKHEDPAGDKQNIYKKIDLPQPGFLGKKSKGHRPIMPKILQIAHKKLLDVRRGGSETCLKIGDNSDFFSKRLVFRDIL